MDKQSNSTTVPEISMLILGSVHAEATHAVKASDLRTLSMEELQAMLDLLVALDDVTCAFLCKPRFHDREDRTLNKAGEIGDEIGTHLSQCIALVEQAAKDAEPSTQKEAERRAWLLLGRAAHYSDDLPRFVAAAGQLSGSVSDVEAA